MNITVTINNNEHVFRKGTVLSEAMQQLNIQNKGIAIAIQNAIIEKALWTKTELKDQDNILVITATQGG